MIFLSRQRCSELRENGTVKMLVLLYHFDNLHQPAGRSREEMIEKYMKKATLKKNISKALKEIINNENVKPEMEVVEGALKTTSGGTAWELTFFDALSMLKILEKLRRQILQMYELNSTCSSSFIKFCYRQLGGFSSNATGNVAYRNIFEQLGGAYVLLDLLKTTYIFRHEHDDCEQLIAKTLQLLASFIKSDSSASLWRQQGSSPFYITMLIDLLRKYSTNRLIVKYLTWMFLPVVYKIRTNYDTLHNCQAVRCLTELMLNTNTLYTLNNLFRLLHYCLAADQRAREEFYQVNGAIKFVVLAFHKHTGSGDFARNRSNIITPTMAFSDSLRSSLFMLLHTITKHFFSTHPEVQDLYWNESVSQCLMGITELISQESRHPTPFDRADQPMKTLVFNSFAAIYYILKDSHRERVKLRQLWGREFFRSLVRHPSMAQNLLIYARSIYQLLNSE